MIWSFFCWLHIKKFKTNRGGKHKIWRNRRKNARRVLNKQNGITLIALVISIIVMLILAGVSISAIVGDDGILAKAQYASFINEMSAIEEAVQMWKVNQDEMETAIPTNGMCQVDIFTKTERLKGEIGFYRVWNMTKSVPETTITAKADEFNVAFDSEMIVYPAGVQDLYYLDNESLGLSSKKQYVIDAVNGMIYSSVGITLNGVRAYSLNMAKALNGGTLEMPLFASAEVSGGSASGGQTLAGNKGTEYIDAEGNPIYKKEDGTFVDANGNKVNEADVKENENYNANGFQIIAHNSNKNIYKLYNNGDLYGKGVKGTLLNTDQTEMNKINSLVWKEFSTPDNIPSMSKVISGHGTMFVIDNDKNLWAWGENHYNYLGLTQNQQNEYTGREAVKLDVKNKKVYDVIPTSTATWVITDDNELYACGYNDFGELGINKVNQQTNCFEYVEFTNPKNIKYITAAADGYGDSASVNYRTIILMNDGKMFFAGDTNKINSKLFKDTDLENKVITKFTEIFNDTYGDSFENKIIYIARYGVWSLNALLLLDDAGNLLELKTDGSVSTTPVKTNVEEIMIRSDSAILKRINDDDEVEYLFNSYGSYGWVSALGEDMQRANVWIDITERMQNSFDISKIKDYFITENAIFFLLNNGKLYAAGNKNTIGINESSGLTDGIELISDKISVGDVEELVYVNSASAISKTGTFMIKDKAGKTYITGNSNLMYRNLILEGQWVKINPPGVKVKHFNASTYQGAMALIDYDNDIWILGNNVTMLGINHEVDDIDLNNFVRLKDYLKDIEVEPDETDSDETDDDDDETEKMTIYEHLSGKVEDYVISQGAFYIKTNERDNNTLYVCGTYATTGWPYCSYSGLKEDAFIPTKLLEDVEQFDHRSNVGGFALLKNNDFYIWGNNNGNQSAGIKSAVPYLYKNYALKNEEMIEKNIKKAFTNNFKSYVITEDNDIYGCGSVVMPGSATGFPSTETTYKKMDKANWFNNENIVDMAFLGVDSVLFLTDQGNIYGCGGKHYLGKNTDSTIQEFTPIPCVTTKNVAQICAGPNWFVYVTNDGRVYGTGINEYGILGRWQGVDRGDSNSRYKTCFTWAECPELEI